MNDVGAWVLRACGLRKEYGKGEGLVRAVDEVDLDVASGETVAVMGPSGCGKSTLIKTITCECYPIVKPETQVSIFGRERWDLTELKKRLGVVSSELPGRPTLTTPGRDAAARDAARSTGGARRAQRRITIRW